MIGNKNEYFPALTGVRALSAFLVYIHHLKPFPQHLIGEKLFRIFRETHIGVSVFFVLSGFLIAYRYYNQPNFSYKKYIVNRVARIYPVYFALTIIVFSFNPAALSGVWAILLLNITFLRGFFQEFIFTGVAQGWTLTVEETFYFLAPIIFYLIKKSRWFLALIPFFCLILGWILVHTFEGVNFHGFMGSTVFMLLYTFFGRSLEFFTGIGLALYFMKKTTINKGFKFTTFGLSMMGLCLLGLAYLSGETYSYGVFHPVGIAINNIVLPIFSVMMLFYGLLTEQTWLSRFLSTPTMVLLGKSSYAFYLIHYGIISNAILRVSSNLLIHFISLNLISIIIFRFFEDPVNRVIRRKLNGSPTL